MLIASQVSVVVTAIQAVGRCFMRCMCIGLGSIPSMDADNRSRLFEVTATNKHPWTDREMRIPVMKVTTRYRWRNSEGRGFDSRRHLWFFSGSLLSCIRQKRAGLFFFWLVCDRCPNSNRTVGHR